MNNQVEELKKEIERLTAKLNDLLKSDDKFKKFIPNFNEDYWFVSLDDEIIERRYLSKNDAKIVENTFTFKTKEHAKEYRSFMNMLKEQSRPLNRNELNYYIYYNHIRKQLGEGNVSFSHTRDLYFDEEVAKQLIKDYPNEIKYWYLEVQNAVL